MVITLDSYLQAVLVWQTATHGKQKPLYFTTSCTTIETVEDGWVNHLGNNLANLVYRLNTTTMISSVALSWLDSLLHNLQISSEIPMYLRFNGALLTYVLCIVMYNQVMVCMCA